MSDEIILSNKIIEDEDLRKEIIEYLKSEISDADAERADFIESVDKRRRQRQAIPEQKIKNWPWEKASNVVIPVAATNTNAISSALKAAFSQKNPFFSVTPYAGSFRKPAEILSEYLDILVESKFHLNLREVNNEIFYDLASLGTQFVSVPWINDVYEFKRKTAEGIYEKVSVVRHKGPAVVPHRIEDIYTRSYVSDLQSAPWVAICHHLVWHELKQRENQNIYENIDEIETFYKSQLDENMLEDKERIGLSALSSRIYDIYECYLFWDIDDDGIPEDIKIWIELDSGVILREEINDLGVRPIVRIPYVALPKQLYGVGVGQMCEHMQDGCDACFNMAVDNSQVSGLQMYGVKRGSGIGPKEKFYPLKQIDLDNPKEDLFPITFPNTAGPLLQLINLIREITDRYTGATNAMMGNPDTYAKTRATASGTMFLAQQSSRLFNAVSENVEEGFAKIGMLIVFQLIRNKEDVDYGLVSPDKAEILKEILSLPIENVHLNFRFSITSTEIEQTEEAKRQALLTLSQLYSMYGQQTLQLLQGWIATTAQIDPQGIKPVMEKYQLFASQFLVGSGKLMGEILDHFNKDKEGLIPWTKDIEMMLELMQYLKEQQMQGGLANVLRQSQPGLQNPPRTGPGFGGTMEKSGSQETGPQTGGSAPGEGT